MRTSVDLDENIAYFRSKALENRDLDNKNDDTLLLGCVLNRFEEYRRDYYNTEYYADRVFKIDSPINIQEIVKFDEEQFVRMMYVKLLGRLPEKESLVPRVNALKNGVSKEKQLLEIEQSEEGRKKGTILTGFEHIDIDALYYGNNKYFIENLYWKLLCRKPDENGFLDYYKHLCRGDYTREDIVFFILNSSEGRKAGVVVDGWSNEKYLRRKEEEIKTNRKNKILKSEIESLKDTVECNSISLDEFDEIISNISDSINSYRCAFDTKYNTLALGLMEAKKALADCRSSNEKQIQKNIKIEEKLDRYSRLEKLVLELEESKNELYSFIHQIGDNTNAINSALEKHDAILTDYLNNDKKMLSLLVTEICNIKSQLSKFEKLNREDNVGSVHPIDEPTCKPEKTETTYECIDYFDFENEFRGSRERIKNAQQIYIPYFMDKKNVLDLGCGRGEFTELLSEKGIGVTGIDQYVPYIEYMNMLGLNAVIGDAIDFLERIESTDGIFVGQVVEHISISQIIRLCKAAYNKLENGCYLIIETPNPTSLAIYTNSFYVDPSHNKPVHPLTLQYILRKQGFNDVEIIFTDSSRLPFQIPHISGDSEDIKNFNNAMSKVSDLLYGSQDYAIIAKK